MVIFGRSRGKIKLAKTTIQTFPELVMYEMNKSFAGKQHGVVFMPVKHTKTKSQHEYNLVDTDA